MTREKSNDKWSSKSHSKQEDETIDTQKTRQRGYDQEYKEKEGNEDDQHRHQEEKEKHGAERYD